MCFSFVQGRFMIAVFLCIALFSLSGCLPNPDIAKNEWEYIRVVYLVRDENDKLQPRSWHTQDKEIIERLRALFPKDGKYKISLTPSASRVNRVDIKLHGGQWWSLACFFSKNRGNKTILGDSINIKDSDGQRCFFYEHKNFIVFYTALTNEIMQASGTVVNLSTKIYSYEEADELGDNDAYGYERNFP